MTRREYYLANLEKERKCNLDNYHKNKNTKKYKERVSKYRKKMRPKLNEKMKKYREKMFKEKPWMASYLSARQRCLDKKGCRAKTYFERGIKFLMTIDDFKFLWFRDNAQEMEWPTIDRINNDKDYVLDNCRYLEHKANTKKGNKQGE